MTKKKIGVLTLPFNNNYGGLLQSYALQTYLKKKAYEVVLLDIKRVNKITIKYKIVNFLKLISGKSYYSKRKLSYLSKNMTDFARDNMTILTLVQPEQLDYSLYEAIVVGSDQVWRHDYILDNFRDYFLGFIPSGVTKKYAYAVSLGKDSWDFSGVQTKEITALLSDFTSVFVREHSGVNLCKVNCNIESIDVLDPVFLLKKEEYLDIILKNDLKTEPGLLFYMLDLDADRRKLIELVNNVLKLKISSAGILNKDGTRKIQYPSVSRWLAQFMNAKFIVTDSFHGCAFAILFNKPFIVFGNRSRGLSRFESILSRFGLMDNLILDIETEKAKIERIAKDSLQNLDLSYVVNTIDQDFNI